MPQNNVRIIAVESALPEHRFDVETSKASFTHWLKDRPEVDRARARRIFDQSGVKWRHSCLSMEEIFTPCSLTESSARYRRNATRIGTMLLSKALQRAHVDPAEVDILITTSCTGFMIPSVDAFMATALGMRPDLIRLPVTEMGCAAGAAALIYASEMLRGRERATVAIVNIELPTNAMQLEDFSMDNVVSTALFSDGAACTVLQKGKGRGFASIDAWQAVQVPESHELLGYNLTSTGFRMTLHPSLPEVIERHFEAGIATLLQPRGLSTSDIRHWVVHPGGVKILDRVEPLVARAGGSLRLSRETMRDCGNMSSATVGVILERLIATHPEPGHAVLMSFGPGFGAHMLLLTIGDGN